MTSFLDSIKDPPDEKTDEPVSLPGSSGPGPGPEVPNSKQIVLDLETEPAWGSDKIEDAKAYCQPLGIDYDPASLGKHPGEWSLDRVKYGNATKPETREKKEAEYLEKWKVEVAAYQEKQDGGHDEFWAKIIDKACLSPATCKIPAAGYLRNGCVEIDDGGGEESRIIESFFVLFEQCISTGLTMSAYNGKGFDFPMILWRAAVLGIEIPKGFTTQGGRYSPTLVDLMDYWPRQMYDPFKRKDGAPSAKNAARLFGCHRSSDEVTGANWWRYWTGTTEEKAKAVQYLTWDCEEEGIIARRLGVI